MKPMKTAKLAFGALALSAVAFSGAAQATDRDVDASVQTRAAISLTKNSDMDFGILDYVPVHSGNVVLATNGTVSVAGAVGVTAAGTPTAGDVTVAGDATSTVDISCETGGTLTDGGANSLTLTTVKISVNGGADYTCAGLGTAPTTHNLGATATPTILMGGTLNLTANPIDTSAVYDTAAAGGNPVTLRVTYQ